MRIFLIGFYLFLMNVFIYYFDVRVEEICKNEYILLFEDLFK